MKNMDKATDENIEALYLIRMYSSDACVMGNQPVGCEAATKGIKF